jgi:NAD(P)H-dependent flavin oxidoreductase YrpB (nitropropane dioxygenase family)
MPTVGALRHAIKAEKSGADIIVAQGTEGGGHTGTIASSVLIPEVVDQVKVPVVAAGGFGDGRGLVSALAMGAGAIYMGTRFALTQESPVAENCKQYYLQAGLEDTGITDRLTGHTVRMLKNKKFRKAEKSTIRVLPWQILSDAIITSRMLNVPLWKLMSAGLNMKKVYGESLWQMALQSQIYPNMAKAVLEGDLDNGFMPSGQIAGRIKDIPTAQELIQRIMQEAEEVLARLKALSTN